MKVDFPVYNRLGIQESNQIRVPNQKSQSIVQKPVDKSKEVAQPRSDTVTRGSSASVIDKVNFDAVLKTNPTKLSDVLTNQEQEMLRSLFPTQNSNWGVGAYDNSSVRDLSNGRGFNLDLIT